MDSDDVPAATAAGHGQCQSSGSRVRKNISTEGTITAATAGPPSHRLKLTKTECCDCTRSASCQSRGTRTVRACACLMANRCCTSCRCFRNCKNKSSVLTIEDRGSDLSSQRQMTGFFSAISPTLAIASGVAEIPGDVGDVENSSGGDATVGEGNTDRPSAGNRKTAEY